MCTGESISSAGVLSSITLGDSNRGVHAEPDSLSHTHKCTVTEYWLGLGLGLGLGLELGLELGLGLGLGLQG